MTKLQEHIRPELNNAKRSIKRAEDKIKRLEELKAADKLSNEGYYELGYLKANISNKLDLIDILSEIFDKY